MCVLRGWVGGAHFSSPAPLPQLVPPARGQSQSGRGGAKHVRNRGYIFYKICGNEIERSGHPSEIRDLCSKDARARNVAASE